MFDAPPDDPGYAPWIHVRNRLREIGYSIGTTYDSNAVLGDAEWIIFINVPRSLSANRSALGRWLRRLASPHKTEPEDMYQRCLRTGRPIRLALFLWEPEVVMPENFDRRIHARFERVFTWHRGLLSEGGGYRRLFWPQPAVVPAPREMAFAQRKLLVNFSGNKRSSALNELYSARVEVIRYMEARYPSDFDHYGPGWGPDHPSWRGVASSKFEVYPYYRFGLCYENMRSVKGWITEKVFDCLRAGTVPVYWGAPDIGDELDEAAFVDRRRFRATEDLVAYLRNMNERDWQQMREAGQKYISGPRFERYLPEAFFVAIRDGLGLTPSA